MRSLRGCIMRRYRLRYALFICAPLLLLVILKLKIHTREKLQQKTEVDNPVEEIEHDGSFIRNPRVDPNPQEWKIGSAERERILRLIALETQMPDEKLLATAKPKEQVLGNNVDPGSFKPFDIPSTHGNSTKFYMDDNVERKGLKKAKLQMSSSGKLENMVSAVSRTVHIAPFNESKNMELETERKSQLYNKSLLLPQANQANIGDPKFQIDASRKYKKQNNKPAQAEVKKPETNQGNDEVMELDANDVSFVKKMHTRPPWAQQLRALDYEDYAANCSKGSLPIPGSSYKTSKFCLIDDHRGHFGIVSKRMCYYRGTDVENTRRQKSEHYCECQVGWHGKFCSVPSVVFNGGYPYEYGVNIQKPPRRIIYAFPFNSEFDMMETAVKSLSNVVDVFLILESNYTAAGQAKERVLLQNLQNGFLAEVQHKIVYISLDFFPRIAYVDGWAADALLRNHIGNIAFGSILENVRDDDIIISLDADEIVRPEALMFLKLHYGYPEPFGFVLKHSVYGYFWQAPDEVTRVYGGCRVSMFHSIFLGQLYDIRNAPKNIGRDTKRLDKFKRRTGTRIKPWMFGSPQVPAGWHCSWCFLPPGIRYKLISAHASDFPRWGTFPDKTNVDFISKLVDKGIWFDEKTYLKKNIFAETNYAPPYIKGDQERFSTLLDHDTYVKQSRKISI